MRAWVDVLLAKMAPPAFHDKRLAFVHADVRRSLLERGDDDRPFRRGFHEASLKISYSTAICAHMRFFAW